MSLSRPQELLTDAFEAVDVMIAVLDRQMNFLYVNRAYALSQGGQPAQFVGKNYFALHPDSEMAAMFLCAARTGKAIRHRMKLAPAQCGIEVGFRYWDSCLSPVRDAAGRVSRLVLSIVNVTDGKGDDTAVQPSKLAPSGSSSTHQRPPTPHAHRTVPHNDFTEAVLDTIGSLVIVLDTQGRIVLFNHACEQTTGYNSEETLGRPFWEFLLLEEEREAVKSVFDELRLGRVPNTHENYWLTKDGRRRWIAWTNTVLRDEQGNVNYIVGTGVDTTDRRLAETALRQSEQQFRLLAENINEMFWLASPDRKIMYYVSPAYETIWGRPRSELYADPMSFLATTPEADRKRILADHAEQARGDFKDSYELEFRIRRPDGEMRWIAARYVPVRDETGRVFRVAGVSADITDRKHAEQERLQYERAQREALVREVHHRIKNTLQGVVGLLRLHSDRHPHLDDTLQTAIAQVTTVALVHGLQSKKDGDAILLCDMCDAIATNIMALPGPHVRLHVTRDSPLPFVVAEADAVSLALVMNELMFNALKHSTVKATESLLIQVIISADADGVLVRLRNPGANLPEGLDVMRGTGLGTGLGLVRTLLPNGASVTLKTKDGWTETEFRVGAPIVQLLKTQPSAA